MGNKKLIIGISVLAIVTAIFIVAGRMAGIRPPEHKMKLFPALEERHIAAFVINDGDGRIRVERCPCGWKVSSAGDSLVKADSALAQIAVERIVSLKKSDIVSDNPANQSKFEVDDGARFSVEIYAPDTQTLAGVLLIGTSGPSWNSNHVRLKDANEVYLMPGGLRQALFFDIERWRYKEPPKPEPLPEDDGVDTVIDSGITLQ
ncbi:MAG: DUF4340 domain-containing protein [Chitinispirillia bacterium]|nr:DUF4340 domain-containing protein [Chitinispirillia bacterium]MCL2242484.1 DUF4340 domain-containing protein [Chitinispirillia bacterium]